MICHPERKGPQTFFSSGVVSRRICGCTSGLNETNLGNTALETSHQTMKEPER
jgi:hypothetical protein